jgi:hypothetical protein
MLTSKLTLGFVADPESLGPAQQGQSCLKTQSGKAALALGQNGSTAVSCRAAAIAHH